MEGVTIEARRGHQCIMSLDQAETKNLHSTAFEMISEISYTMESLIEDVPRAFTQHHFLF
jgi:hypothetical protein